MNVTQQSQTGRRLAVMRQIGSLMDRLNATQESVGLPPLEAVAGSTDALRLDHVEGLVGTMRVSLVLSGEVSQPLVVAAAAQVTAWLVAIEERDECRIDSGEAA